MGSIYLDEVSRRRKVSCADQCSTQGGTRAHQRSSKTWCCYTVWRQWLNNTCGRGLTAVGVVLVRDVVASWSTVGGPCETLVSRRCGVVAVVGGGGRNCATGGGRGACGAALHVLSTLMSERHQAASTSSSLHGQGLPRRGSVEAQEVRLCWTAQHLGEDADPSAQPEGVQLVVRLGA